MDQLRSVDDVEEHVHEDADDCAVVLTMSLLWLACGVVIHNNRSGRLRAKDEAQNAQQSSKDHQMALWILIAANGALGLRFILRRSNGIKVIRHSERVLSRSLHGLVLIQHLQLLIQHRALHILLRIRC